MIIDVSVTSMYNPRVIVMPGITTGLNSLVVVQGMAGSEIPKRISQLAAVGFVTDVFVSIALPTTLFALGGRSLDQRWSTSPWMTVIGFLLAIALSGFLVYRKARRFAKELK